MRDIALFGCSRLSSSISRIRGATSPSMARRMGTDVMSYNEEACDERGVGRLNGRREHSSNEAHHLVNDMNGLSTDDADSLRTSGDRSAWQCVIAVRQTLRGDRRSLAKESGLALTYVRATKGRHIELKRNLLCPIHRGSCTHGHAMALTVTHATVPSSLRARSQCVRATLLAARPSLRNVIRSRRT